MLIKGRLDFFEGVFGDAPNDFPDDVVLDNFLLRLPKQDRRAVKVEYKIGCNWRLIEESQTSSERAVHYDSLVNALNRLRSEPLATELRRLFGYTA